VITPLRKRSLAGALYTRDAKVEAKLLEVLQLPPDEVITRCAIEFRENPAYVPSECVVYLLRACRNDKSVTQFERLYAILARRFLRSFPPAESEDTNTLSLTPSLVRDKAFGRFIELLVDDHNGYSQKLDFYEVRFDMTVAKLRLDAQRQVWRDANRSSPLEIDRETGEFSVEVEMAAGSFDPFNSSEIDNPVYRSRLDAAIDALPDLQRRIIEMLRLGFPIDSIEPKAVTIANALKKSEKTIRTHRDKAYAILRSALEEGETP
jgi:hypothetical protein